MAQCLEVGCEEENNVGLEKNSAILETVEKKRGKRGKGKLGDNKVRIKVLKGQSNYFRPCEN